MLNVNPKTSNSLKHSWDTFWNDSNAEGVQVRNLCEETTTANASFAPEVARLPAREAQLPTRVSKLRNQETELQGQLQNLHQ